MKKNLYLLHWLLIPLFLLAGCNSDDSEDEVPPEGSEYFVSATNINTVPKAFLQGTAAVAGYVNFVQYLDYDVNFFRFNYKTTYKGNQIEASGLLGIPKDMPSAPALLSAQHGTMFRDADAPSNFPASFTGFELFASAGYITLIPDFIGYGVSKDVVHPYYDQQHSASAVIDMIKAVKFYLRRENIAFDDDLFLVGYSEGGYVTMAAQKEIESNAAHNLKLTGVVAGAGGYDITGMLSQIASTTSYPEPSFLPLFLVGYNTTNGWNRPLTDFFQEPYASRIPALLNGSKSREEINSQLTTSPAALFNPTFYANLMNSSGETALKQAIASNSLLNWVPKTPTRLYHGTQDEAVFYQTSVTTYNQFRAAGATNVELISIQGGMHRTSIEPMMLNAMPWLESLND